MELIDPMSKSVSNQGWLTFYLCLLEHVVARRKLLI